MTLDKAQRGASIEIVTIEDALVRVQAIRLGLCEGVRLKCIEKLPAGPVILQRKMQQIAIGRQLARSIIIREVM